MHRLRFGAGSRGGSLTGRNPTDRGKLGTKRHLITDTRGTPLALAISGANRHDMKLFEVMLDLIPPVRGKRGRPRRRPRKLHADKGYDYRSCRAALTKRRIKIRIA